MAKSNKPPRLSKAELATVLEQATADFAKALDIEDEGTVLAKADPGHEAPAEENPEGSSSAPPAPEASASAPATDGAPATPPAEGQSATGESPMASPDPAADPAAQGQGEVSVEQIKAEFDSLDVEEVKKYFLAAKASLMEKMGGPGGAPAGAGPDASASPDGSAPPPAASPSAPPAAAASPSPSPSPEEPPMGKGEFDDESGKVSAGKMAKSLDVDEVLNRLSKAEAAVAEVAGLKKAIAEKDATIAAFEEKLGKVAAGVQRIVDRQPLRKSFSTSAAAAAVVAKPGSEGPSAGGKAPVNMTRPEAIRKLNEVTRNPSLKKTERETINAFVAGNGTFDSVVQFLS